MTHDQMTLIYMRPLWDLCRLEILWPNLEIENIEHYLSKEPIYYQSIAASRVPRRACYFCQSLLCILACFCMAQFFLRSTSIETNKSQNWYFVFHWILTSVVTLGWSHLWQGKSEADICNTIRFRMKILTTSYFPKCNFQTVSQCCQ